MKKILAKKIIFVCFFVIAAILSFLGGISFLIILINSEVYLLDGNIILDYIKNTNKKSIPYSYIEEKGYQIEYSYNPILNYINTLDNVYFKGEIKNEKD